MSVQTGSHKARWVGEKRNSYAAALSPGTTLHAFELPPVRYTAGDTYSLHDLIAWYRNEHPEEYFLVASFIDGSQPNAPLDHWLNQATIACTGKICHIDITNMQNETFSVYQTVQNNAVGGTRRTLYKAFRYPTHHFILGIENEQNYRNCMKYLHSQIDAPYSMSRAMNAIISCMPWYTGHTCASLARDAMMYSHPTALGEPDVVERLVSPYMIFIELHNNPKLREVTRRVLLEEPLPSKKRSQTPT